MNKRISRCKDCHTYTMDEDCPKCQGKAASPHPPKFSPEDRYGKYRRQLKALAEKEDAQ